MKQNQQKVAKRIKMLRLNRALSQEALALACGVTCRTISNAERSKCVQKLSVLWNLADFFQISMDDLIGRTIPGEDTRHPLAVHLTDKIYRYDDKKLRHLAAYVDLLEQYG